jgi:type VII secretion protein EccB
VPLNLSNRDQNTGHLFYNRRLRAAITRHSVRMKHDDRKQQAALALSAIFVLLGCGWMALLGVMKPAGLAGQSPIIGNRDTGAVYARIDGRLHPAFNLTSARLATGSASAPTWVQASEIDKFPTGPMIGIPGIPAELTAEPAPVSAWNLCDTAASPVPRREPTVTAIAGDVADGERARPMRQSEAIVATHHGDAFLIWNSHRMRVDLTNRAITFNLGLNPATTPTIEVSSALFDAIPATEPLTVPLIPGAGTPSRWLPASEVGRILQTQDATGAVSGFYVLLADGVQRVTAFVADLLRAADSHGVLEPQLVSPDSLVNVPEVSALDIGYYPTGKLTFVDTAENPVTCISWRKQSTDPLAATTVLTGRGLPTPPSLDSHIVDLVGGGADPATPEADQTLVIPGAATFVASTSGARRTQTRESLFWVSAQGVRYGIERDDATLQALAVDPARAVQAPWPILRTFAAGPAITHADALVARDSVTPADGTLLGSVPDRAGE